MAHARLLVASLVVALFASVVASSALAEEKSPKAPAKEKKQKKEPYEIDAITGRVEPANLKPGDAGKLIVSFEVGAYKIEDQNLKVEPIPAMSVKYGKAVLPKPTKVETDYGDTVHYFKHDFELSIPFTLDKSLAPGTKVGAKITYTACDDDGCGPDRKVQVEVPIAPKKGPTVSEPVSYEEGGVSIALSKDGKALVVRFEPTFDWHFYLPGALGPGDPISITPKKADGVTWGKFDIPDGDKLSEPLEIRVPFTRTDDAKLVQVEVTFAGCSEEICLPKRTETLGVAFSPAASAAVVKAPEGPKVARGDVAFPVIDNDDLGEAKAEGIAAIIKEKGLAFALGLLFVIGAGLAFTPCVFPIIPLVVATIGGGGDVPKGRLTVLLSTYVLGLCLAFATLGVAAAFGGGSMSAAFEIPAIQYSFVVLFVLLAFGMLGLFELQPPQWLMKLQGGAQNKAGSLIGAFLLGILGAVLASPCTGPVIAGLLLVTADAGDALLGFSLFFALGLGMGAVFFAFGSLNFALRPGPWMVWVRYVFGMLLFGGAMYYLGLSELARGWAVALAAICCIAFAVLALKTQYAKHSEEKARGRKVLVTMLAGFAIVAIVAAVGVLPEQIASIPVDLLLVGLFIAAASAFALYWHLHGKEGELALVARKRSIYVGLMYAAVLAVAAFITWPIGSKVDWIYVSSKQELIAEINKAKAAGKPAIVDLWATSCTYCKEYDKAFAKDDKLLAKFKKIVTIKVDLTDGELPALRGAIGVPPNLRPVIVFFDRLGRIRRNADVLGWLGENDDGNDEHEAAAAAIHKRLDLILGDAGPANSEVGKQ